MGLPKFTIFEVLQDFWWIGALAMMVALIVTPIVRLIAYRARIVDRPDALLKPHERPTAYLGGVAMCVGLLVSLGAYVCVMPDALLHWRRLGSSLLSCDIAGLAANPVWNLVGVAVASVVITAVGLLDDICDIRPRQKVYGQVLAAAILLAGGIGHEMLGAFTTYLGVSVPMWLLIPVSSLMCIVMVIATCNATNLLDGLDGLCGGVTGIIALGFLVLAASLARFGFNPGLDLLRGAVCLAMAGTVFGFLPYNIPPASIFMGDAGSMLLGFLVAAMMALFCKEGHARFFVAACVVFALPILDTALAVVRRLLARKSIFTGDRSHLYDQLVDRGMTVKRVVGLFYVLAAVAAVFGVALASVSLRYSMIVYVLLLAGTWVVFCRMGMVTPPSRGPDDADAEKGRHDHAD